MNTLDFPVYVLENEDGTLTILIRHDSVSTYNCGANAEKREKTNNTRKFCNWIRTNLKEIPTEFRFMSQRRVRDTRYRSWSARYKWVNSDKCFVAYNLTRNDLMRIKLSWTYKTEKAALGGEDHYTGVAWVLDQTERLQPSDALKKRMEDKVASKKVLET